MVSRLPGQCLDGFYVGFTQTIIERISPWKARAKWHFVDLDGIRHAIKCSFKPKDPSELFIQNERLSVPKWVISKTPISYHRSVQHVYVKVRSIAEKLGLLPEEILKASKESDFSLALVNLLSTKEMQKYGPSYAVVRDHGLSDPIQVLKTLFNHENDFILKVNNHWLMCRIKHEVSSQSRAKLARIRPIEDAGYQFLKTYLKQTQQFGFRKGPLDIEFFSEWEILRTTEDFIAVESLYFKNYEGDYYLIIPHNAQIYSRSERRYALAPDFKDRFLHLARVLHEKND